LVLGLGINAMLARLLPTADLGVYFLLVSLVALSATLAQAGVLQALLRRVALSPLVGRQRDAAKDVKATCIYVGIGLAIVSSLVLVFFEYWVDTFAPGKPHLESIVFLIIVWIAALAYQGVVTESFRGLHDIRNAVLFGGILTNAILIMILSALFVEYHELTLIDVVALMVGMTLMAVVLGFGLLFKRISGTGSDGHLYRLKSLHREAMPLLLSGLLAVVLTQGDLWLVGLYLGNEDAAIYGAAAKLAVLAGMPLNLLNAVLPPYIAQLHANDKHADLERVLRGSASIASVPAVLMATVAIFAGSDLLGYLYGDRFRQAAPVLTVLCVGQLLHVLFGSGGLVLMLTRRGKALMVITLISSVLLVTGGALAASYGVKGVAIAAASALALQKIIMWKWVKLELGISTHARFGRDFLKILRALFGRQDHGSDIP